MTSGIDNWRDSFVESVVRMAASPEIQISYLQELGVGTDELALEFDSLYVPERLSLTDRQSVYAVDLDRLLTAMSPRCQRLRMLASGRTKGCSRMIDGLKSGFLPPSSSLL